jgi:hypothetical protein
MRLQGLPLRMAQAAWLVVTAAVIALDIIGIPANFAEYQSVCTSCGAGNGPLTAPQAQALHAMGFPLHLWAGYYTALITFISAIYVGMGALLFLRRSNDRMALFAAFTLVTFGGGAFTGTMKALPSYGDPAWWLPVNAVNVLGQTAFVVFFSISPNGRFVPRWSVAPALIWSLAWALSLLRSPLTDQTIEVVNNSPLFLLFVAVVVIAQVYRYRRVSTPRQRKQTKWMVYGFSLGIGGFLVLLILSNTVIPPAFRDSPIPQLVAETVVQLLFLLIPISIAIAILRSRLYDIDVLINRTLVYGSLTLLLAAVYFGSVVGLQHLAAALAGSHASDNPLTVVLSTLLIAALFTPLRRRVQRTIDRRFYRAKYDAATTLERFAMALRTETDLDGLTEHLMGVVHQTMQPAHVSLWLHVSTKETDQ